jgi:hypothetical protein
MCEPPPGTAERGRCARRRLSEDAGKKERETGVTDLAVGQVRMTTG